MRGNRLFPVVHLFPLSLVKGLVLWTWDDLLGAALGACNGGSRAGSAQVRYAACVGSLVIVLLLLAGCGDAALPPASTAGQESSSPGAQAQLVPPSTATPSPKLPGSITPAPASERYRLDLGDGVVVAFVEGLSPKLPGKVAYVTHVPTGSQLVLNPGGEVIDRHNGRDDGPGRLDAVLADQATLDRILEGLQGDEDLRPRASAADCVKGGVKTYQRGGAKLYH